MKKIFYFIVASFLAYGGALQAMQANMFSVTIQTSANGRYKTLINAQETIKKLNSQYAAFYKPSELHMTLLYLHIPAPKNYDGKLLADKLSGIVSHYMDTLASLSFTSAQGINFIQGSSKLFLAVNFKPEINFSTIKEKIFEPVIERIKTAFPGTTVDPYNYHYPDFHISLGYLKHGFSPKQIQIPDPMDKIANYQLAKSEFQISVRDEHSSWLVTVPATKKFVPEKKTYI